MQAARTRRRGDALETAILDAAWEELAAVGYARLSMEGVAARAGTSKAVLYRRWPSRAELVLAAFRRAVVPLADDPPDTGDLRADLLALLRSAREHFLVLQRAAPDAAVGLVSEIGALEGERELFRPEAVPIVLRQAAARGEIDLAAVPPRVARLPLDLNRHEVVVTGRAPTDEALVEIVDQVVLPALRAAAGRPA